MTSDTLNTQQGQQPLPGGCELKFHWRVLGTPAPVFPGFEVDLRSRVPDQEKADAVWHRERAKAMLRDHPEIKKLFVRTHSTIFWSLLFAGGHIAIALAVMNQPWWIVVLAAYVIGSWIDICLFNLAHEYNHSAVFRREPANRWFFTLMSLPMAQPGHHTWWVEHHIHHNDLGAPTDFIKRRRTVLLALKDRIFLYVTKGWLRRATSWITTPLFWPIALFMLVAQVFRAMIGLLVYAVTACVTRRLTPNRLALSILADEHLVPGYERQGFQLWAAWYPALSLTLLGVLAWVGGWQTIAYLMLSALFMTGFLHPAMFGLILSNSHFHGYKQHQPTSSYYGWLNWITFNIGLHTEHHDLARIPWNHLPKLRQIAPEYYDDLIQTRSYSWLAFRFAFGNREDFNDEDYRNMELTSPGTTSDSANLPPMKTAV